MNISSAILPALVLGVFLYGVFKKVDVFAAFTEGAKENLKIAIGLLPTLVFLSLGVGTLRASGALEALSRLASPLTEFLGFPAECFSLAILRPISGSGALAILENILEDCGPDSFAGRVASVLMGSTETTFYTIAVYFGATKIKKTRHALGSALAGDISAFILSALAVRLFFGR